MKSSNYFIYCLQCVLLLGPNAPIVWVKECIEHISPDESKRDKILTGLNFYGNDYTPSGGGPIVSHDYIKLLQNFKGKLLYDSKSVENYFEVKYVRL